MFLTADDMSVNAGLTANIVALQPFTSANTVDLGGTGGGATLGLTDAGRWIVTAPSLIIGS